MGVTLAVELACYLVVALTLWWRPGYRQPFLLLAVAGFLGEQSSIVLYGYYGYSEHWSMMLHRTPLAVVLVWPIVVLSSAQIADKLAARPASRALISGGLVIYDTLVIEPVATAAGLWWWKDGSFFGVPLLGLLGWGIFGVMAKAWLWWHGERHRSTGRTGGTALLRGWWLPIAIALGTQLVLAPMVVIANRTGYTAPLSPVDYGWIMGALALTLIGGGFWLRYRTAIYLDDILPKILGATIFFATLYGLWIEPLIAWCSLAPLPYWGLAFRLRPRRSDIDRR